MKTDLVLVDKPKGISSFDVIRILRKKMNIKKIGHAGTLDPRASGLLILGIGAGTKKLTALVGLAKTYEVEVLLGKKTTTGDMEGNILESTSVTNVDEQTVVNVLNGLIGVINLPVPAYSAIKIGGEALYKKARRGEFVNVPIRKMNLIKLDLTNLQIINKTTILYITMNVSSGSYVRSISEEIGKRLGCPATTKEIRRTRVGDFYIKDALKI